MRRIDTANVRIPGTNLRGWRAIAVGGLGLYILLFIVLNNRQLEVNFVLFKIRSNELLSLIVILILGFVAGFIVGGRYRKARPSEAQPRTLESGTEPTQPAPPAQDTAVGRDDDAARSPS